MSIGDSLFEHFSKNVIENALDNKTYYKDKSFFEIFLDKKNSNFDFLQVAFEQMINHIKLKKLCF